MVMGLLLYLVARSQGCRLSDFHTVCPTAMVTNDPVDLSLAQDILHPTGATTDPFAN